MVLHQEHDFPIPRIFGVGDLSLSIEMAHAWYLLVAVRLVMCACTDIEKVVCDMKE